MQMQMQEIWPRYHLIEIQLLFIKMQKTVHLKWRVGTEDFGLNPMWMDVVGPLAVPEIQFLEMYQLVLADLEERRLCISSMQIQLIKIWDMQLMMVKHLSLKS